MYFLACRFWLETVAALAVLALVGGWALWPFRNTKRRYLYLAAPTAGIAVLSLALTILYVTCHLSVPISLAISLPLLSAPTVVCLVRWWMQGGKLERWALPLALAIGVSAWATYCCNRTAIITGEPTISMLDGTDAFGYAQIADHFLRHPNVMPTWSPTRPHEAWVFACEGDPRPGAFLLTAAAAFVQRQGALYAYDWATGIALAAGILALAGAFPTPRLGLVLLVAAGGVSAWLTYSRSGYFGKLLTYPGCLLLVSVVLATWQDFSPRRLLACAILSYGVTLCHSPITPTGVLVLALAGVVFTVVHHSIFRRQGVDFIAPNCSAWLFLLRGAFVCCVAVGPFLVLYPEYLSNPPMPPAPLWKHRILAIGLGIDNLNIPFLERSTILKYMAIAAGLQVILWLVAYRARSVLAQGLFLSLLMVPLILLRSREGVYQLAGFPGLLSILGVVILLAKLRRDKHSKWLQWGIVAIGIVLIGLRVPQGKAAYHRYVKLPPDSPHIYRKSEIDAIAHFVGNHRVDMKVQELYPGIFAMQELGPRVRLQIKDPTWHKIVEYSRWPVPWYHGLGRFTIIDYATVPDDQACYSCRHFQLVVTPRLEASGSTETDGDTPPASSSLVSQKAGADATDHH
jgi:hypothetical protein